MEAKLEEFLPCFEKEKVGQAMREMEDIQSIFWFYLEFGKWLNKSQNKV